ncbi:MULTISPECIES: hypothetical protein [Ectothiorhodospira]|uniref:hypothetical protein n=1 Tax=Ectothiorhodospira TaxID=1051 RepID=UPI001EE7B64B|nr:MULTISPECIES: hypothetical protein [Ectothiorhodospira]MCG5495801.1 hypothetical protein [Ectothiorhodospira variabilis]MCG5498728.1 hypothetical protein [Ectothiorhodospira variabilis]MCG5504765.1 hypothetical protein [Ectothiorhodospira variabilis]MCG5507922.1 hypothetical protein [Ectothiorhodospira variabilis]MCG5525978.1 hypothetical protein [Ectothiorhodospira haloalkaliphila]
MSESLQLSGELVHKLQDVLVEHDERCHDPLVTVQYMSAISGYLLGSQPIPEAKRQEFLEQLAAFMRHVHDDVVRQQQAQQVASPQQSPQEAFGVWRPGDP